MPNLPTPESGELYMRFTDEEMNCLDCPSGDTTWLPQHGRLTTHRTWLYQAIKACKFGDVFLMGGDFQTFDVDKDNPYYPGGFWKALLDALERGVKIIHIIDRFYVGGRDMEGNCTVCNGMTCVECRPGKPYDCDDESIRGSLFGKICNWQQMFAKQNIRNPNYIVLDIPNNTRLPHSHCKLISFYLPSSNRVSVYKGSWNISTLSIGWGMKETGFGCTAPLRDPWGQLHLYRDYWLLKVLENMHNKPHTVSDILEKMLYGTPQNPFVTVPIVYYCGPDYCDPNFGCGTDGGRSWNTCTAVEKYQTGKDKNVTFTFGVNPPPQNLDYWKRTVPAWFDSKTWKEGGWPKFFPWGFDLVKKLLYDSRKFVKTMIHSGALEAQRWTKTTPTGLIEADGYMLALQNMFKRNVNWFCLQNDTYWRYANKGVFAENKTNPHMYAKMFTVCGRNNKGNPARDPVWPPIVGPQETGKGSVTGDVPRIMTHDKLWISEKAFLLSSAHPVAQHYNAILNEDTLIEGAYSLNNYINNHFNHAWTTCAQYPPGYIPSGPYVENLGNMTCSDNQIGCCTSLDVISKPKKGFGNCISDPCEDVECGEHGKCVKGSCICDSGWKGKMCEEKIPVDPCEDVECGEHGKCVDGPCICDSGYTGNMCEEKIPVDPCDGVDCGSHGRCVDGPCICDSGWKGKMCEEKIPVDPCEDVECGEHGKCVDGPCICDSGYTGNMCEEKIPVDPCDGVDCGSHGRCVDGPCICDSGYTGEDCSEKIAMYNKWVTPAIAAIVITTILIIFLLWITNRKHMN